MDNEFLYEMDDLMNEGRFEEVAGRISELDEDEICVELRLMLAHALSQCAKYHEAIDALKNVDEEMAGDDIGYHLEMAGALFGLHYYRAAVKEAEACIEIDENCVEPWLLLCLVYQETGQQKKFENASEVAKEIDEEAWNNIFGDAAADMEVYEEEDMKRVLEFVVKHFGMPCGMLPVPGEEETEDKHPINCLIVKPDDVNDFYKVISIGIGAHAASDKNRQIPHRIEMAAFLPPSLTYDEVIEKYGWLARIMRQFGEMVHIDDTMLAAGHSISYGEKMDSTVEYNGAVFNDLFVDSPDMDRCIIGNGEEVHFLRLVPLYEEEMMFKIEKGVTTLFRKFMTQLEPEQIDFIIPDRPNVCAGFGGKKKWAIPRSSMELLIEWEGADGCYATDRITVDGCRVGFMIREKPDSKLDSGWRFFAGDEDQDYMDNPDNSDIFSLNTICNYDPDIIEYLESPVGTALYRDKNGYFCRYKNRG